MWACAFHSVEFLFLMSDMTNLEVNLHWTLFTEASQDVWHGLDIQIA